MQTRAGTECGFHKIGVGNFLMLMGQEAHRQIVTIDTVRTHQAKKPEIHHKQLQQEGRGQSNGVLKEFPAR